VNPGSEASSDDGGCGGIDTGGWGVERRRAGVIRAWRRMMGDWYRTKTDQGLEGR